MEAITNTVTLHGKFVVLEILEQILLQYQEEKKSPLLIMTKLRMKQLVVESLKLMLTTELHLENL